jgi:hypothetical protein
VEPMHRVLCKTDIHSLPLTGKAGCCTEIRTAPPSSAAGPRPRSPCTTSLRTATQQTGPQTTSKARTTKPSKGSAKKSNSSKTSVSLSLSLSARTWRWAGRNPDSEDLRARIDHYQYRQRGPRLNQDDERHGESPPRVPEISVRLPFVPRADSTRTILPSQNDTFGTTGAFLSGTMTKMKKMARRQGGQWCLCACPPSPFYFLPCPAVFCCTVIGS